MVKVVSYDSRSLGLVSGVGVLREERVVETPFSSMRELMAAESSGIEAIQQSIQHGQPVDDAVLREPVGVPAKMLFSGINYRTHKEENPDAELPTEPFFFSKLPSAIIGPNEDIRLPFPSAEVDYEVELCAVIGRVGSNIPVSQATDHVFGYTIANDVSERSLQMNHGQLTLGKGLDTFCPLGPCIALIDEIPDTSGLGVRTYVNGELRQDDNTSALLFSVPELVSFASRGITLMPGDIISTGTPGGVGYFMKPYGIGYLGEGDTVTVEVDRIGAMSNAVVAGWA